jgi:cytochrome c oxidase subunit II
VRASQLAPPLTEQAHDVDRVWSGFLIAALVVGAIVFVLIAYVVVRYRRRDDRLPFQRRENIPIEITYMAVPLLMVGVLFGITFVSVNAIDKMSPDPDLTVKVTGFQWQWQFEYPADHVTVIGSDVTEPNLVLPADTKVQFDVTSIDVIHSFWIPGFRFKRDMFPGQIQSFQVDTGDLTGSWPDSGVCAEFCGLDHHSMRFSVQIMSKADFATWVEDNKS